MLLGTWQATAVTGVLLHGYYHPAPSRCDGYYQTMTWSSIVTQAPRWLLAAMLLLVVHGGAQDTPVVPLQAEDAKPANSSRPLPEIAALMLQVEARQRAAEAIQKDYIYHSVETAQEVDGHGAVKKTEVKEYDVFWIDGVPVRKLLMKDGRPLSPDETRKESERIDKEAAKAKERRAREDAKDKQTDPRGNDEVTVSRLLELGSFTNPRRLSIEDRDTIAVDYTGDLKAKTRNSFEGVIRDMAGTVWIDEQDKAIARIQGRFIDTFKIGGGLLVRIQQGTNFELQQKRVNGEVWLPASVEGHGEARALLFFKFNGNLTVVDSDYRKFKTSTTILPSVPPAATVPQ